jgi:hypothetical protein
MEASLEGELLEEEGADVVGVLPNEGLTLALGSHHAYGDMDSEDEGSFCSSAHSQAAAHTAMVEGVPLDELALRGPLGQGTPDRGRSPRAGAGGERQVSGPLGIICRTNSGAGCEREGREGRGRAEEGRDIAVRSRRKGGGEMVEGEEEPREE